MPLPSGAPIAPQDPLGVQVEVEVRARTGGLGWETVASGQAVAASPDATAVLAAALRELADMIEAEAAGSG